MDQGVESQIAREIGLCVTGFEMPAHGIDVPAKLRQRGWSHAATGGNGAGSLHCGAHIVYFQNIIEIDRPHESAPIRIRTTSPASAKRASAILTGPRLMETAQIGRAH